MRGLLAVHERPSLNHIRWYTFGREESPEALETPRTAKVAKIANSIKNRLQKNPELNKLNEKNTATLKKLENSVVKDVDKWIKNNKSKYINKQGAYKLFETDLFKFLEKDYSRLIKTAKAIQSVKKPGVISSKPEIKRKIPPFISSAGIIP